MKDNPYTLIRLFLVCVFSASTLLAEDLLVETFDDPELPGWAVMDEPVYTVADGKLDWAAQKFDAFVGGFAPATLKLGEYLKLSITADFDVLSGQNNTFRFGLMAFGEGNVPSADQATNSGTYEGGIFATLAHKPDGTSRIMTHVAASEATILESFKVDDVTVNIGATLNGSFGLDDNDSKEIVLTVIRLIDGYEIHYTVNGMEVFPGGEQLRSVDDPMYGTSLSFDAVALYANHPWEGNIDTVMVEKGMLDSYLLTETFDDAELPGWAVLDEPVYTVADGKLDWAAQKFDAFVSGFAPASLTPGEYLTLSITADFDVLSGQNNTFRFGLMAFGDGNVPSADQATNSGTYEGGIFGTLAHKPDGTSRIMTHVAASEATILESFKVDDVTVNIGATLNGSFGLDDNESKEIVLTVIRLIDGYEIHYTVNGMEVFPGGEQLRSVDDPMYGTSLSFDAVALYANHPWEGNIDTVIVEKGTLDSYLLAETFEDSELAGWFTADDPDYTVSEGSLNWNSTKLDSFVHPLAETRLSLGEALKLSVLFNFTSLNDQNNTFRFGFVGFGENDLTEDLPVNSTSYDGGLFGTLANKELGKSRIHTLLAATDSPLLESNSERDNVGETITFDFAILDLETHLLDVVVVRSGNGYIVRYSIDDEVINEVEFSRIAGNAFVDDLVFDGLVLYSNHEPGFEMAIDTVTVEHLRDALPTSSTFAVFSNVTADMGGAGWIETSNDPFPDPEKVINLSQADDYLVAQVASQIPGLYTEKSGSDLLELNGFGSLGTASGQGANTVDVWQVVFDFDDGDPVPARDDYYGVSWIGNWSGNPENNVFAEWTVQLVSGVNQVKHWWNHGIAGPQVLSVTHFSADGTQLGGSATYTIEDGSTAVYVSTEIAVEAADGDYLVIRNEGTNVGWRATQLVQPIVTFTFDTTAMSENGEGWTNVEQTPFPDPDKVINLSQEDDFMLAQVAASEPGLYSQKAGSDLLSFGGFGSLGTPSGQGANTVDTWQVVFDFNGGDPVPARTNYYGVSWNGNWSGNPANNVTLDLRVDFDQDGLYTIRHWWNHGVAGPHDLSVSHLDADGNIIGLPNTFNVATGDPAIFFTSVITIEALAGEALTLHHEGTNIGWRATSVDRFDEALSTLLGAVETGDGQFVSPWFGSYQETDTDWILHAEAGWLYMGFVESAEGMWIWSNSLQAWLWTSRDVFPVYYQAGENRWITYIVLKDIGGYLYDFSTGNWVMMP